MKKLHTWPRAIFASLTLILSTVVQAVPTLSFHGNVDYTSVTGRLDITATLTASEGIAPTPELLGSTLALHASFLSVTSNGFVTLASFEGINSTDLIVEDGNGTTLLTGEFQDIQMKGLEGMDSGKLTASFSPLNGSLLGYFSDPSDLIALELNLTTPFGVDMFARNFSGLVDGDILSRTVPAPEPGVVLMLLTGLGLMMLGSTRQHLRLLMVRANDKNFIRRSSV